MDTAAAGTEVLLERAMRRALELARLGPSGGPNPQVGCVLLGPDGDVLAEGWHRGAGTPHAEADALAKVPEGAAAGATAVVTLEPCDHTGRTGPCSVALIDAGVARVVVAQPDPNPLAAGGAERLRAAGVAVEIGVLGDEAAALNERWATALRLGRPWVTAKWASSLDGRIAAADGSSRWITGPAARADVHRRRAEHGAILVGSGTVLTDDPALTARDGDALLPHQPRPVVVGLREPAPDAAVRAHPEPLLRVRSHDPAAALEAIADTGATSAFLEGGPTLLSAFLAADLVDEVLVYLAPTLLGGDRLATLDLGVPTIGAQRRLTIREVHRLGDDLLVVAHPDHREA
ncbi:bifunctional diaminohydroxyphosphoribosylaminopyrimidine deaminase/5-amino-6-(5-phosphoribosylamino)uracil reductase RibD [Amnibacterium kyonggiense]|uniref:Riboflavin biosynthesis protein RibD n=1 Tax=Amnibacterium kyonggiense TaxID=595671 RepID=A0A4R7FEZ4_9MICO|nr:bifunctional diaminohydroxyphosphoribosylaminopyrimidine deaminase/5-amino-6-(5-phosphoribosylamino)uracil reductase RibD [Amnibacterium kyonggiense]TDS75036.1 diaminohydroxyphosphoribosylaminopyrimidine deaminase/5-amino-6-(5-phosphoribosylamino)uracil reductase [Amnibacterium kyonggiense]